MLVVDWAPNPGEGDKVLYLFDGGQLAPETLTLIALQADELKSYAFLAPDEINERTIPRLARRILAATEARREGVQAYLEHGEHPQKASA
ncbi:hypothetical protein ABZ924_16865 [Streptomyces sp. NPDC046876]|uniref:hypothetical protein n=1 Tax=Streptomyces sp. NPDC046876 TaxID=3155616 RepID=UPI0033F5ACBF